MMCCTTYRYLYFLWEGEVCGRGGGYTVSGERIAKLFRYCRIMFKYAEMPSHGRLGKALCATAGA